MKTAATSTKQSSENRAARTTNNGQGMNEI
jgi:hypothetical protein